MHKNSYLKYLLVAPSVLLLSVVSIIPIGYVAWLSVQNITMLNFRKGGVFVGFANYVKVFTKDPLFWPAFVRTLEYVAITIIIQLLLGFVLALLLNNDFKGRNLINNALLIPVMTTPIVIATLWKYLLNFNNGGINIMLNQFFGIQALPWLTNKPLPYVEQFLGPSATQFLNLNYGFVSIVLVNVWQWTPFVFLLLYAGLRSLPLDIYEAAKVDGASYAQTLRFITLPLLKPVITVVFLLRLVDLMKVFDQIWALFGNATFMRTLNIHLYTVGLMNQNYGMGAAYSVIVLALSLSFSLIFLKAARTWEEKYV